MRMENTFLPGYFADKLFESIDQPFRETTARTILWNLIGSDDILKFLDAENEPFIHDVRFSSSNVRVRVNPLTGQIPRMEGVAGYDEMKAKFNINSESFTVRFQTSLVALRAEQPSPQQMMYNQIAMMMMMAGQYR